MRMGITGIANRTLDSESTKSECYATARREKLANSVVQKAADSNTCAIRLTYTSRIHVHIENVVLTSKIRQRADIS
jgi:hypothetical protein